MARGIPTGLETEIAIQLSAAIENGVRDMGNRASGHMRALAQVFSDPQADASRRVQMHRNIARAGQEAILDNYESTVTAKRTEASKTGYRSGATDNHYGRYAGGALRAALSSPQLTSAFVDGFSFINHDVLDKQAAHWYRLNFGWGTGSGGFQNFTPKYGGVELPAITFDGTPSDSFKIPRGFWIGGDGRALNKKKQGSYEETSRAQFYPFNEASDVGLLSSKNRVNNVAVSRERVAGPFAGRHYLNPGLEAVANTIGRETDAYFRDLYKRLRSGMGPDVQVDLPTRPRSVGFSSGGSYQYRSFSID